MKTRTQATGWVYFVLAFAATVALIELVETIL
jgi:hypothetical protein